MYHHATTGGRAGGRPPLVRELELFFIHFSDGNLSLESSFVVRVVFDFVFGVMRCEGSECVSREHEICFFLLLFLSFIKIKNTFRWLQRAFWLYHRTFERLATSSIWNRNNYFLLKLLFTNSQKIYFNTIL